MVFLNQQRPEDSYRYRNDDYNRGHQGSYVVYRVGQGVQNGGYRGRSQYGVVAKGYTGQYHQHDGHTHQDNVPHSHYRVNKGYQYRGYRASNNQNRGYKGTNDQ